MFTNLAIERGPHIVSHFFLVLWKIAKVTRTRWDSSLSSLHIDLQDGLDEFMFRISLGFHHKPEIFLWDRNKKKGFHPQQSGHVIFCEMLS